MDRDARFTARRSNGPQADNDAYGTTGCWADPPNNWYTGWPTTLPRANPIAPCQKAPQSTNQSTRRPVIFEPLYNRSTQYLGIERISTSSISSRPKPMQWVPRARMRSHNPGIGVGLADAHQGLVGMYLDDQVVLGRDEPGSRSRK